MARPGFTGHRKFRRLVTLLGIPEAHALGLCEFLWATAYEAGDPHLGDTVDVELAARWTGTAGALAEALLACGGDSGAGLVEPDPGRPGTYRVHDLLDHAPEYVARRMQRELDRQARGKTLSDVRADAARARWSKSDDANGSQLQTLADSPDANGATPAPSTRTQLPAPAPSAPEKAAPSAPPPIPSALDSEDFRQAWADWHAYRRERNLHKWTPMTIAAKFQELEKLGPGRAIAAIRHSIANGCQGIYEPKAQRNGSSSGPPIKAATNPARQAKLAARGVA